MSDTSTPANGQKQEEATPEPREEAKAENILHSPEEKASPEDSAQAEAAPLESEPEKAAEAPIGPKDIKETPADAHADVKAQPGAWGQFFNGCAAAGPLMLFLVLAALVWGGFWKPGQGVYCPPESDFVAALLHCLDQNYWLAPAALADGGWTAPQWPLFYWLAWCLSLIPGLVDSGLLLPTLSTIATAVILLAVWCLPLAAGFGPRSAFAAGLIIICAPFFVPVAHFVGPMPMAAALMLLSLAFFARGWRRERAWLSLPLGFVLAGLAGLCGGPLYLLAPLLASACFLIWQGRFIRAHAWDAVFGFALMLVLTGGWLAWVTLGGSDNTYLSRLFSAHVLATWPPVHLWWRALLIGVCGILPWTLLVFTVSWPRVLAKSASSLVASRKDNASALVWTAIFWVCAASPFLPLPPEAGLPLIFLVAVLLGRVFENLSPVGNRAFFLLAGIFVCLLGIIVLAASFSATRQWLFALLPFQAPEFILQPLEAIKNLFLLGILLLVFGLGAFFFARSYQGSGGLVYGAIAAIAITQLAVFMIAPDLAAMKHGKLVNLETIEARVAAASRPAIIEKPAMQEQARPAPVEKQTPPAPVSPVPENSVPAIEPESPVTQAPPAAIPEHSAMQAPATAPERMELPAETPAPFPAAPSEDARPETAPLPETPLQQPQAPAAPKEDARELSPSMQPDRGAE